MIENLKNSFDFQHEINFGLKKKYSRSDSFWLQCPVASL